MWVSKEDSVSDRLEARLGHHIQEILLMEGIDPSAAHTFTEMAVDNLLDELANHGYIPVWSPPPEKPGFFAALFLMLKRPWSNFDKG